MAAHLFKINMRMVCLILLSGAIMCETATQPLIVRETEPSALHCTHALQIGSQTLVGNRRLLWRKDGKVLRQVALDQAQNDSAQPVDSFVREDARISLNAANGTLSFASVLASDAGAYVCELHGEGAAPLVSDVSELQVIELLKFAPQPTSKNMELGGMGKVHCKAQGTPTPQVKWLSSTGTLPPQVLDKNGTLHFSPVSMVQRGNYTCIASNSQGQINATVMINVVVAPKFSVPPHGPVEVAEGDTAYIHCQATGDPTPTVQWDRDLQYLNENNTDRQRFQFHLNGTLEIRTVRADDEARYGCTIGSSAGFKREDVLLIVQSRSNSLITRIIIIVICLAFLYFVLILGLKLCCRERRQLGKVNLNDVEQCEHAAGEGHAEHEPWLTEANSSRNASIAKSKKLRESTIIEQESSQVADDIV